MSNNFKIAIFSSGSGSNFEAIVKAKIPNVEISFLFCNVEDAFVLERAKNLGIESIILSHKGYKLRKEYEEKIISIIEKYNLDLIVLAGFKRILSPFFTSKFPLKIINLHPSILPAFTGLHAPRQALEYGSKFKVLYILFSANSYLPRRPRINASSCNISTFCGSENTACSAYLAACSRS